MGLLLAIGVCNASSAALTAEYLLEGNATDTSGFGRDGALEGTTSFGAGLYQGSTQSLLVDPASPGTVALAADDYVRNAPGATLLAWVRLDGGSGTRSIAVINNGDAASGGGIGSARGILQVANGDFRVLGRQIDGGGSSNLNTFTPELGTTYLVAGVFDYTNGEIVLYVDGAEVGRSSTGWSGPSADTANLTARIGSHANGTQEYWQGAIDGVRFYDEVLSETTIFDIYTSEAFAPIIPGDTDGNGVVNGADLTPIALNYRQSVTQRSDGDLDGDGQVTFADFREFKTALLDAGLSLAELDLNFLSAVPEPASALLGALALAGVAVSRRRAAHLVVLLALSAGASSASAAAVVGDPVDGYNGVDNMTPAIFTVDPFDVEMVASEADRGITEDRRLRQTFKNPSDINVGEILISFNVTGGSSAGSASDTGLGLRIYEVDDVLASEWLPVGAPIKEILFTDTLPGSNELLSFKLNNNEIFELPARFAGTTGYGIEISTPNADTSDGNPGVLHFSNESDNDFYPDGRYYVESGNASSAHRDVGLSIIGTAVNPFLPGDTNGDDIVDVETDLAAIAANFRQTVADRIFGDLTGDNFVDFEDFDQWKSNYEGSLATVDLSFLSIPEPSAALLLLAALGAAPASRRRISV